MSAADTPPDPEGGWSTRIVNVPKALVVPPAETGFVQATGILDSAGTYCPHGALWRRNRALTIAPQPVAASETLQGTWLWGGVLWSHFGHFLAESTARLWALDHLAEPVNGVLFVPKRPRNGKRMKGFHQPFFDLMGLDAPVKIAVSPTQVEKLVVPGQGFGLGDISSGTAAMRDCYATRFARDIAPHGPDRLYVSRSGLGADRGSILGETYLEQRLQQEGYEVFHPQHHSMEVQIARYRAARQVVATDGSALHLLAMSMPKDQQVAIIARRKSSAVDLLETHVAAFTGREPLMVDALRWSWFPDGKKVPKRLALGELSLSDVGAQLAAGGFVDAATGWQNLSPDEVASQLAATGKTWHLKPWALRKAKADAENVA